MNNKHIIFLVLVLVASAMTDESAVEVIQDVFRTCLQKFRIDCVKPRTLEWVKRVSEKSLIRITEDLALVKTYSPEVQEIRGLQKDILESFEDFLQTHDLVAKVPSLLRPDGPFGSYIPRSFQPNDLAVPLAATGRSSKLVKNVIFPFLLGLKFKTAVLVPLALALIALKTWKALTLGLLSLVLTGAIAIFSKFVAPKAPLYEVVHYPEPVAAHLDYHDYHQVEVLPGALPLAQPIYGRNLNAQEMAYSPHSTV